MLIIWFNRYFLWIILGIATIFGYFWLSQNKKRLQIKEWMALLLAFVHTLVGVLCVKVFAFLEGAGPGSMSLFGAIFFLPVFYFAGAKLFKRKVSDVFDAFTILVIFTLMCSRFNCLKAGCCLGSFLPGSESLRWPNRELEILFYIVMLVWLGRKSGKAKFSGQLYPLYMIAYGAFRFVVEWLRESEHPVLFFHISHIWALISIVVGVCIYRKISVLSSKKSEPGKKRTTGRSGS